MSTATGWHETTRPASGFPDRPGRASADPPILDTVQQPFDVDPVDLLRLAYGDLCHVVDDLSDEEGWAPTGCAGWTVRDLTWHLLTDAQRALVALGRPIAVPADTDAVSYWRSWQPGTEAAAAGRRFTRVMASVWSRFRPLQDLYLETNTATVHQASQSSPDVVVQTQGHRLTVANLLVTLVVEAGVHHLDLVAALDRPGPGVPTLGAVRHTLDGLFGGPVPLRWSDEHYARAGTGRIPLTSAECDAFGPGSATLPALRLTASALRAKHATPQQAAPPWATTKMRRNGKTVPKRWRG